MRCTSAVREILESILGEEDAWWWVKSQARNDVVYGVHGYITTSAEEPMG